MADEYYVGLMSGTSLDGVDAVLARFDGEHVECVASHYQTFDESIRAEVLSLHENGYDELQRAALLDNQLAAAYADATRALLEKVSRGDTPIRAIGCHGQTVRHAPQYGYTIQRNNPALLAELTGITVVADFRSRDIAAGGQGAPLVPAFHDALFRSPAAHRVILNIGGIANLTDLAPGRPTTGFDCGPGNMLMDAWTQKHHHRPYDENGAWAATGKPLPELLARFMQHPFLALPPPKSCGREEFNLGWLVNQLSGKERPEDVQATLVEFTAAAITDAIRRHCGGPDDLYVCGGGAHNAVLMQSLSERAIARRIATTDFLGQQVDHVEAMAFAWLACRTLHGEPGNLPAVTGAHGPRVLGAIYPA
ncbi:MAG: anhydro-N-acetylmuramic acid kinase [Gammaproteobacteria bacterium]|nr:anhydro-N-acetylmuramic acid kinase [Gammaproteobacteria bacterium]MBU1414590.1 anhydro-N-acetylmuramic acid kinase [Gammaproteobacteria bacterium]